MENTQNSLSNVLVKKLSLVLSVLVFLLPVFFIPVEWVSLYVAKITLLATGLVAIFAIFLSLVLSTGIIEIPKVKYLIPIGFFALVSLLSSVFSGSINASIVGSIFNLGTSGSMLILVFSLFMTLVVVRNLKVVNKVITAFVYSSVALAIYTLLGTLGASILPTSIASKLPLFLSGGPIDTAVLFGAVIIFSLCALNMSEMSKRMRVVIYLLMAYAMLFIGAINFMPVIVILGIVSLVLFVYILSWSVGSPTSQITEGEDNATPKVIDRKISFPALIVLVISVVFLLGGAGIGSFLSGMMNVQSNEVRPNFETTMDLTLTSWQKNFALGIGPNRFAEFWAINKPIEINQTQFWNTNFSVGSGFIPTIAITTGLLGLLSLIVFVGMYLLSGVKAIFAQANSGHSRYLATVTFLMSLYLWIMFFLYNPNITILSLAFIFTGLSTATLVPQGIVGLWRINIFSNPKTNFLSILSIMVLLILLIAGGYTVWERAIATVNFEKGVVEYQKTGNIQLIKESTAKSINVVSNDVYWRGLTEIYLIELGQVLGSITDQNQISDTVRAEAQTLIANSIESAKRAVQMDDKSFQNWFALGRVYEILASNGIEGTLENARNTYAEAALYSPLNPSVPLALARLDALAGNADGARANIAKALELKNNYTDAYFTLAQLEVSANNISGAIKSVEAATIIDPTNSGLYFQLGLLKYNQKDFTGAASSFERATVLVPDYANAKYFLGLSYYQTGKEEEAIKQFEELNTANPDNQEISVILDRMKNNEPLFSNSQLPTEPPVEEN